MKVVQINTTCGMGSTGKICVSISEALSSDNIENYIFYTSGKSEYPYGIKFSNPWSKKMQAVKSRIFGNYGFNSKEATKNMIKSLNEIKPDIIHLHNIHGHDCNIEELFEYINKKNVKVLWTFHDCWAFTGYCTHFDMKGCKKWKDCCEKCPQKREYSWLFDKSKKLFLKKKELFKGVDLTVITPSDWLGKKVKESFLKEKDIKIIKNGIDLSIFKPCESNFREKYGLCNKKIVLGVSFVWSEKKGLDVFVELAKKLPKNYKIVLVGTNKKIDEKLPQNIISIHRTKNQQELAEIYSSADVFINPTREENYPTVNMEAIACGTPVVTFKTGGSPETINECCGVVVEKDDVDAMEQEIIRICEEKLFVPERCVEYAKRFDKNSCFEKYLELYRSFK